MTDGVIINRHQDCLTQSLIAKNTVKIHPAESTTNTRCNVYGEIRVILEVLNIRYVGDILYQINLSALQSHGLGRSITHVHQFYFIIRNFLTVVRVRHQIVSNAYAIKGIDHVRTCSDRTIIKVFGICHINNSHGRMCQLSRKVCIRLSGLDGQSVCLIISSYRCLKLQIFLRFCRTTRSHLFQILKILFYFCRSQIAAIREFDTVFQSDDPLGMLVIYRITLCQPWLNFHAVVEFEQTLGDTVTHSVPSAILIRNGIYNTIGIHLTSESKYFLISGACRGSVAAAVCGRSIAAVVIGSSTAAARQ